MKYGLSVLLAFYLSFYLSGCFLGIVSLFFSKFWHGARNQYEVVCDGAGFSGKKKFCLKNWENGPKKGQKRFFKIY